MKLEDITVLLVEDQEIILESITRVLEKMGVNHILRANSSSKAFEIVKEVTVDLFLLDINLNEGNFTGIQLANKLKEIQPAPHIFITANSDDKTLTEAIKTKPEGYIVKPFTFSTIKVNLQMLLSKLDRKSIQIQGNNKRVLVRIDRIASISSDKNYIELYLDNGKRMIDRISLKKISESLPSNFVQIHKSHIVDLNKVQSFNSSEVQVLDKTLPIGRSYKEDVKSKLNSLKH